MQEAQVAQEAQPEKKRARRGPPEFTTVQELAAALNEKLHEMPRTCEIAALHDQRMMGVLSDGRSSSLVVRKGQNLTVNNIRASQKGALVFMAGTISGSVQIPIDTRTLTNKFNIDDFSNNVVAPVTGGDTLPSLEGRVKRYERAELKKEAERKAREKREEELAARSSTPVNGCFAYGSW